MPKRSQRSRRVSLKKTSAVKTQQPSSKWFRWGESYTSLMMGIIVVIIAFLFLGSLANLRHIKDTSSTSTVDTTAIQKALDEAKQKNHPIPTLSQNQYVVQEGDSLWSISQKFYNTGYKWTEIAQANNLSNPNVLNTGTTLVIPQEAQTEMTAPTTPVENAIKSTTYTVVHGDTLWDIAVRAYADGYKWTEIARVNNLQNPDLIHAGNVLQLPR